MSLLFDETTGTNISKFIQLEVDIGVTQIISKSLDGTTYIQNIGRPDTAYNGTVYVDRLGKSLLEAAQTGCNLLRAEVKHGTYYGRITDLKFSKRMAGDYFQASFTLAKEVTT